MKGTKHEELVKISATWGGKLDVKNRKETVDVNAEWATVLRKYCTLLPY
jgi:hypothetical protein